MLMVLPIKAHVPRGTYFTKCFKIRKYQTSYENINLKAHWGGFIGILNTKTVFTLKI